MEDIKTFENERFGKVRTVTIDDEPWFVGKDVAVALGYKRTADALKVHVNERDKKHFKVGDLPTLETFNYGAILINEPGLYKLILSSKLESALDFQDWVTHEVLPTLRKSVGLHGSDALLMLDKKHQKQAMANLHESLLNAKHNDYIKANTIADKATSNYFGLGKMVKKDSMPVEMLPIRAEILDSTVELMALKEKYGLDLSDSKAIYKKYPAQVQ